MTSTSDYLTSSTTTAPVMEQIDPSTLLIDTNVRADATPDKTLIESVRDLGVLVPVVAVRTEDGVRVRYGHRRTRAAVEAGRATIPVWVFDADSAGTDVDRIVRQWAENEHRESLTDADRLAAVEQLSAFGVSAAQISKRLRAPRKNVDAALSASKSTLAKAALVRYDFLDLAQAAVVAEFEDDPETVKALVVAARDGRFDHVAQQARDERTRTARVEAFAAALTEQGVTIVERGTGTRLGLLVDAERLPLTVEGHAACPGHAAYLDRQYGQIDPATGYPPVPSDNEDADDSTEDHDASGDLDDDEDGYDDEDEAPGTTWGEYPVALYVCADPDAHGHAPRYGNSGSGSGYGSEKPKRSEMTPEQAEAARAERRDVIASNKAWNSSVEVRRTWLRTFLARKTPPKGSAAFVAAALAQNADTIARVGGNSLAADLLGCQAATYGRSHDLADLADKATEARAQVLTLALVLAGYEDDTHTGSWRSVNAGTRRYLTFLAACGYTLSDVERRACGEQPLPYTDQVTDEAEAHDLDQAEDAA